MESFHDSYVSIMVFSHLAQAGNGVHCWLLIDIADMFFLIPRWDNASVLFLGINICSTVALSLSFCSGWLSLVCIAIVLWLVMTSVRAWLHTQVFTFYPHLSSDLWGKLEQLWLEVLYIPRSRFIDSPLQGAGGRIAGGHENHSKKKNTHIHIVERFSS